MSQVASARLAELLRTQRYHEAGAEQAVAAAALAPLEPADARLSAALAAFVAAADALLLRCCPAGPNDMAGMDADLGTMEARYEDLKADLLAAGADARLALNDMEQALRRGSALRRAAQQLHKSRRRLLGREGR